MVGRERKGEREGEIWKDRERGRVERGWDGEREKEREGEGERRSEEGVRKNWREGGGGGTKLDIINKSHNSLHCSFLSIYT